MGQWISIIQSRGTSRRKMQRIEWTVLMNEEEMSLFNSVTMQVDCTSLLRNRDVDKYFTSFMKTLRYYYDICQWFTGKLRTYCKIEQN